VQSSCFVGSKTGYVDGRLTEARFNSPFGLALSPDGQSIFTADDKNHAIRKISLSSGYVSTVIGGIHAPREEKKKGGLSPPMTSLCRPHGLGVDLDGNLLVADTDHHRLLIATPTQRSAYKVKVLAGSSEGCQDGKASEAAFRYPYSIIPGPKSGLVYAADTDNHRIVRIYQEEVVTIAGSNKTFQGESGFIDGPSRSARFMRPSCIALSPDNTSILVTDHANQCIRLVLDIGREEKCYVKTIAGTPKKAGLLDGDADKAQFNNPFSATWLSAEMVCVSDLGNDAIRIIDITKRTVNTIVNNKSSSGLLVEPVSVLLYRKAIYCVSRGTDSILIADKDGDEKKSFRGTGTDRSRQPIEPYQHDEKKKEDEKA